MFFGAIGLQVLQGIFKLLGDKLLILYLLQLRFFYWGGGSPIGRSHPPLETVHFGELGVAVGEGVVVLDGFVHGSAVVLHSGFECEVEGLFLVVAVVQPDGLSRALRLRLLHSLGLHTFLLRLRLLNCLFKHFYVLVFVLHLNTFNMLDPR